MQHLPLSRPAYNSADFDALNQALSSGLTFDGPCLEDFERALAEYAEKPGAVTASSAWAALVLALTALHADASTPVIMSAIAHPALAQAVRTTTAPLILCDTDPLSGLIDPESLADLLSAQAGRHCVVIVSHLGGQLFDFDKLGDLKARFNFTLIEDATEALGARGNGWAAGGAPLADLSILSFAGDRIISCGNGGAVLCSDPHLAAEMVLLRNLGLPEDPATSISAVPDTLIKGRGFDFRLGEAQAALGLSQLDRLGEIVGERAELARAYSEILEANGIILPGSAPAGGQNAWNWYPVGVRPRRRDEILSKLRTKGILACVNYPPLFTHPGLNLPVQEELRGAMSFASHSLALPLFPGLGNLNLQFIAAALLGLTDA